MTHPIITIDGRILTEDEVKALGTTLALASGIPHVGNVSTMIRDQIASRRSVEALLSWIQSLPALVVLNDADYDVYMYMANNPAFAFSSDMRGAKINLIGFSQYGSARKLDPPQRGWAIIVNVNGLMRNVHLATLVSTPRPVDETSAESLTRIPYVAVDPDGNPHS